MAVNRNLMMPTMWLCLFILLSLVQGHPAPFNPASDLRSFSIGVTRNPHYKPDGPAQYMRALVKWGADVPTDLADFVSNKGSVGEVVAKNQTNDLEYLSPVNIGNPPQELLLDLDSGSSDLWVFSSETKSTGALSGGRQIWNPELSTTASKLNDSRWSIIYGDGSYATGNVWKDQVNLGGIIVPDAIVESAVTVSRSLVSDEVISGLLGLAYKQPSQVTPTQPTFLEQMEPLLDQLLYTVDLRYHASGMYQFGAIDHSRHIGNITWVPLSDGARFWDFPFTSYNVGSTRVWLLSSWRAIADTGTTLILLQPDLVERYYAEVAGAAFNDSLQAWTFPCAAHLPDFNLGFGGGGGGWHATVPGKYINYLNMSDYEPSSTLCYGGIQENGGLPFSILGDVFLKAVFAIFDKAGSRIGFADKVLDV